MTTLFTAQHQHSFDMAFKPLQCTASLPKSWTLFHRVYS